MKVVAVVGSPRLKGNTSYLTDVALQEIQNQGIETEKIMLCRYRVNPCSGHDDCDTLAECRQKDDAPAIIEKFRLADGLILATPVYYFNMTAQMKAFVDRNYFLYTHDIPLKATCAGLIVIGGSEGMDQTVRALRRFLKLSVDTPEQRLVTLTGCANGMGEVQKDAALVEQARQMGRRLAGML
ncbi:MAG: flavodoxin family protein [Dehalococcoidales bacterium]|nr:flavodoxin family protein [Dehalococcoidales bacterium]